MGFAERTLPPHIPVPVNKKKSLNPLSFKNLIHKMHFSTERN
jgi:hypothetical protein